MSKSEERLVDAFLAARALRDNANAEMKRLGAEIVASIGPSNRMQSSAGTIVGVYAGGKSFRGSIKRLRLLVSPEILRRCSSVSYSSAYVKVFPPGKGELKGKKK